MENQEFSIFSHGFRRDTIYGETIEKSRSYLDNQ